jgi:hypothetical protein
MTTMASSYPARFDIEYPEHSSRWLLFLRLFFFWAVVIPYAILSFVASIAIWLSWFAIMNDGRYPRLLIKPMTWYLRISYGTLAYLSLMTDRFPLDEEEQSPVSLSVDVPARTSRLSTFFRFLLVIPQLIVFAFVALAWYLTTLLAWFAILFTGRYPRGLFNFGAGVMRWSARLDAYRYYLIDEYPPFSVNP